MKGFGFIIGLTLFIGGICSLQPRFPDLQYGEHPEQSIDIYEPSSTTLSPPKIILIIHGGAWNVGDKRDMGHFINQLAIDFPDHYITNMNFRLATIFNPAYPKQLDDIELAIQFLRQRIHPDATFGLFGESSGAHLAMLYSYQRDSNAEKRVKVIADVVGPVDFTDPWLTSNPLFHAVLVFLVGDCSITLCPTLYNETSPVKHVSADSPKTIGFYGDIDILIPNSQMPILRNRLNEFGIVNNFTVYPAGHTGFPGWDQEYFDDSMRQIKDFFHAHW